MDVKEHEFKTAIPNAMDEVDAIKRVRTVLEGIGYAGHVRKIQFMEDVEERRQHHGTTHFVVDTMVTFNQEMCIPDRLDIRYTDDCINIFWGERHF